MKRKETYHLLSALRALGVAATLGDADDELWVIDKDDWSLHRVQVAGSLGVLGGRAMTADEIADAVNKI